MLELQVCKKVLVDGLLGSDEGRLLNKFSVLELYLLLVLFLDEIEIVGVFDFG